MSSTYSTQGIVLHRYDWRESDSLFHVLTKTHGKMTVVAVGSKKIKSKLMGHLASGGIVDLMVAHAKHIDKLAGARLMELFPGNVTEDYFFRTAVLELLLKNLEDGERDERVWELTCGTLRWIGAALTKEEKLIAVHYFAAQLMQQLGYAPELDVCAVCGVQTPRPPEGGAHLVFSCKDNGVACRSCRVEKPLTMSVAWLELFTRLFNQKPTGEGLQLSAGVLKEGGRFMHQWLSYVSESPLHGWRTMVT